MTREDNQKLILFLETFKHELLAMAEGLKTKVFKRSELEDIFVFNIAMDEERNVIQEMVSEVAIKGDELNTGPNSSLSATEGDPASLENPGSGIGKAKVYTSSHFQSDREVA
ncbi:MAG: hypothetical protein PHT75_04885 [Bacilli bacterium]|nr:hypothetical protein [Bacilli bacterium]MDD3305425.1 hypothetical protein [Bacilli bacterium]MDD4054095.1 hypothetical protein [Bacilli bacterium]MDD4411886.1 hypothetical protein [Bacilli bacterium]